MVAVSLRVGGGGLRVKTRSYGWVWAPMDGGRYGSMVGRAGERWKGEVAVGLPVARSQVGRWRDIVELEGMALAEIVLDGRRE